jgi:invasion protein IalB
MGKRRIAAGAAVVVAALLVLAGVPGPAAAGYVFFYQHPGDWTVVCWREMSTQKKSCRLSAPPASLFTTKLRNVLDVRETSPGAFVVEIEIRDEIAPGLPLFLRIDDHPIHEAAVTDGSVRWAGGAANGLIEEMRTGKQLVFRVQTAPYNLPRDTPLSLEGFASAFDAYRQQLRIHGLLPMPTDASPRVP